MEEKLGFSVNIAKDTPTTKRIKVLGEKFSSGVKVEISFRESERLKEKLSGQSGLRVYSIDSLAKLKLGALSKRVAGRDLYDLAFIIDFWSKSLKRDTLEKIQAFFQKETVEDFMMRFERAFLEVH